MIDRKTLIDEKTYRVFKGSDWPEFDTFIDSSYQVDPTIEKEISDFISVMQEKYDNIATPRTIELSVANQTRQKQVFFDKKYKRTAHPLKYECRVPWDTLGINSNGNAYICESPSWVPVFVGNLLEANDIYTDILNSPASLKIRQEIKARRYYYCNNKICEFFDSIDLDQYQTAPVDTVDTEPLDFKDLDSYLYIRQIPETLIFDFDYTCNFKCPSCRVEVQNWNNDHIIRPINDRLVEKIKSHIIDKIDPYQDTVTIRWCGGEPFMSEVYLELFEYIIKSKKQSIQNILQTNGSLIKAKKDLIRNLLPYISEIRISFDAGCEETYNLVRVGGNWDQLIENTKLLLNLIEETQTKTKVTADYVVQKNNYKDLPKYIDLCKELGIKPNGTQKMWNWGTWDETTFKDMNVYDPGHPLYEDVKKYFQLANLPMAKN